MIACWCLPKCFLTGHISTDIMKGIYVAGSHRGQQLGLRNGSYCLLKSRLCLASVWLCDILGFFMVSLWSGQPGILPTLRARLWIAGCRCTWRPPLHRSYGKGHCLVAVSPRTQTYILLCQFWIWVLVTLSPKKLFLHFTSQNGWLKMLKSQVEVPPVQDTAS